MSTSIFSVHHNRLMNVLVTENVFFTTPYENTSFGYRILLAKISFPPLVRENPNFRL